MKAIIVSILLSGSLTASCRAAELPKASTVFTIYEFLPEPNHGGQWAQDTTGVVVCKDKRAFFWCTRATYQELQERYRKSAVWVPPPVYSYGYGHKAPLSLPESQQKLPDPKDIFAIYVFPGQEGLHFTPDSLLAALPKFVQERPPQQELDTDWPAGEQRGVFVLTDGRVLPWRTHSKQWILLDQFTFPTGFFRLPP